MTVLTRQVELGLHIEICSTSPKGLKRRHAEQRRECAAGRTSLNPGKSTACTKKNTKVEAAGSQRPPLKTWFALGLSQTKKAQHIFSVFKTSLQ